MTLRTVYLHGEAGRLFGRKWRLDVATLSEAVRAIGVQVKGFQQYIESRDFQVVRGSRKTGVQLGAEDVTFRLGNADLHIMPVLKVAGGKTGGIGKIIAGVLLAGFAFFAAPALGLSSLAGVSMKTVGTIGIGLAITGASSLMSPQQEDDKESKPSNLFGGVPNVSTQGLPVPILVGKTRCQSMPIISARIVTAKVKA